MSKPSNAAGNDPTSFFNIYIESKLDGPNQKISELTTKVENLQNKFQADTASHQKEMKDLKEFMTLQMQISENRMQEMKESFD